MMPAAKSRGLGEKGESISTVRSKGHTSSWKHKVTINSPKIRQRPLLYHSFVADSNSNIISSFLSENNNTVCLPASSSHIFITIFPSVQSVFLGVYMITAWHCFSRGTTQHFLFTASKPKRSKIIRGFVRTDGLTAGHGWTQQIGLHLTAFSPS